MDSYINHRMNAGLPSLLVRLFVSSVTSDLDCFEIQGVTYDTAGVQYNFNLYCIDANNIKLQTGVNGLIAVDDTGTAFAIAAQNWNYNIGVWYIG